MTRKQQRLRAEVLRDVVRSVERHRDGELPMDVAGVEQTFRDEVTLLSALHLRWFTRLSLRVERRLRDQPVDREAAVTAAWVGTAREMPGIRAVLDHHVAEPLSQQMAVELAHAIHKDHTLLAVASGVVDAPGPDADRAGAAIEARARAAHEAALDRHTSRNLVARLKAVLAA